MKREGSKAGMAGVVIVATALLIWALTIPAVAETETSDSHSGSFAWPSAQNRSYFREAFIYQIRKNRDIDMLSRLDVFTSLADAGASEAEIATELIKVSRQLRAVPMRARIRTGYDDAIRFAFAAANLRAHASPPGAAGTYGFADAVLQLYRDVAGDKSLPRSFQRQAAQLGSRRIEGEVVDRAMEAYANRPGLDFQRHFPRVGMRPGDGEDVIARQLPGLRQIETILDIENRVERKAELIEFTKSRIGVLHALITRDIGEIKRNIEAADGRLSASIAFQYEAAEALKRREINWSKVEGIRSAASLATTLVKSADPDAGRRLAAVTDTAFRFYDAVNAYKAGTRLTDGLTGFASLALTGKLVSAGQSLIQALVDTEPIQEEMIHEEIGKLHEQAATVHDNMHDRFELVDLRLNPIHETLISGLKALHRYLTTRRHDIKAELKLIEGQLAAHENHLAESLNERIDLKDVLFDRIDDRQLQPCIAWKTSISTRDPMDRESFIDCLLNIHALATGSYLENLQQSLPSNRMDAADKMRTDPDRTVEASLQAFQELSTSGLELPAVIVGPKAWLGLADLHDRFLDNWPEHTDALAETQEFATSMQRYRNNVVQFIEAIRHDYFGFVRHAEGSAIASRFSSIRSSIQELDYEIQSIIESLDRNEDELAWSTAYSSLDAGNNPQTRHRTLSDASWKKSFSFVKPTDCPYSPARQYKQLRPNLWNRIEKRIKRTIESSHPGFVNMLHMGMVKIYVCPVHDIRRRTPGPGEAVRINISGRTGFGWNHTLDVLVHIGMEIETQCEGKIERQAFDGEALMFVDNRVVTSHRSIPPVLQYSSDSIIPDLTFHALKDLEVRIWEEHWKYLGFDSDSCIDALEDKYANKRADISDNVKRQLRNNEYLLLLETDTTATNAYIASWLRLALHDALHRSDLIQSILSNRTGFPSPKAMLEEMRSRKGEYVWTLPRRLLEEVNKYENTLRSPYFAYIMREEYGNSGLTQTQYLGID